MSGKRRGSGTDPVGPGPARAEQVVAIDVATVLIEFQSSGRLLPWIGPALRGIVAGRFRERHCRLSLAEQAGRWRRCRGCMHLPACAYGRTFEPDEQVLPTPSRTGGPLLDVPRTIVLAPAFPAPVRATPGLRLPLSVVAIGPHARESLGEILGVLGEAGRAGVFGSDRVRFGVVDRGSPLRLSLAAGLLPDGGAGGGGIVSRLRLILTSPLFLRDRDPRGRPTPCRAPTLHRLVRAAVDTVAAVAFAHAMPVGGDTRRLVALARAVRTVAADWQPFEQEKHSNRSRSRFDVHGVVGEAEFADVPKVLIPWLALAGQLHVGGHRVAGAGGWRLEISR
jgi:hypothetical protein